MSGEKPKRLAIAISGAVSLGSYEAGVLYEVLNALGHHNDHPATTANPSERIEVDVLTGASAGGMSAAILSQKMLYQAGQLSAVHDNALYNPWVRRADIGKFLALVTSGVLAEDPAMSILSSRAVEEIAEEFIVDQVVGSDRHPASANRIWLGMALSNLSGVDFGIRTQGGGSFGYTRFREEMLKELHADQPPVAQEWREIREAAISCGAFPIAFRVKGLGRLYASPAPLNPPVYDSRGHLGFTDGGMFHNEPLKMAKDLVNRIDRHRDNATRFYLYMSPHVKGTLRDETFKAETATIWKTAMRLVAAIRGQAGYHDLLETEQINTQIDLFDHRSRALADAILNDAVRLDVLESASAELLRLFKDLTSDPAVLDGELRRLRDSFGEEVQALQARGEHAIGVWLRSILVLEAAAGLCDRDHMRVYTITADEGNLAGEQFHAFGGFFSEMLRRNDYELGRKMARQWLERHSVPAGGATPNIGPIRLPDPEPVEFDPALSAKTVRDVNPEDTRRFRDQVLSRLNLAMDAMTKDKWWHVFAAPIRMGVRGIVRGWIDRQFSTQPGSDGNI